MYSLSVEAQRIDADSTHAGIRVWPIGVHCRLSGKDSLAFCRVNSTRPDSLETPVPDPDEKLYSTQALRVAMSYYFCIVGTKDNPLFEHEFGTSKQGGDGVARFPAEARHMNQFIVHSSLDIVDEVQWLNNQM